MNNTSHPNATIGDREAVVDADVIAVVILSVLAIATVTTNGLVLLTIFKDPLKCLRSPSACFIAGLTTANLLTGLLVEPALIYWLIGSAVDSGASEYVGWIAVLLCVTAINASLLIILAMAVTQYIVVSSPALYRKIVSPRSARIGVLCIFLYAIFFSLLPIMGMDAWVFFEVNMFLHTTLITISVVVIYILMYCKFRRQWGPARSAEERGSDESEQQKRAMDRDFTKGTFILTAFMILTVWPYTITQFLLQYQAFDQNSEATSYLIAYIICLCIFMTKFALDPVIFAWRLKTYRQSFAVVFRRMCSCGDTSALPAVSYHVDDDNEGLVEEPAETVLA